MLGVQDEVEPPDPAVPSPVPVEVDRLERLVAVELRERPVVVEDDREAAGDPVPLLGLPRRDLEALPGEPARMPLQHVDRRDRPPKHPRRHDVRVHVVPHALAGTVGVSVVELVGTHDVIDRVALAFGVIGGERGEEPCDGDDEVGALVQQELQVAGGLVVLPGAVRHPEAHVPLQVRVVGHPLGGERIEQPTGCHVVAGDPALPREHRARVAGACRGGLSRRRDGGVGTRAAPGSAAAVAA